MPSGPKSREVPQAITKGHGSSVYCSPRLLISGISWYRRRLHSITTKCDHLLQNSFSMSTEYSSLSHSLMSTQPRYILERAIQRQESSNIAESLTHSVVQCLNTVRMLHRNLASRHRVEQVRRTTPTAKKGRPTRTKTRFRRTVDSA